MYEVIIFFLLLTIHYTAKDFWYHLVAHFVTGWGKSFQENQILLDDMVSAMRNSKIIDFVDMIGPNEVNCFSSDATLRSLASKWLSNTSCKQKKKAIEEKEYKAAAAAAVAASEEEEADETSPPFAAVAASEEEEADETSPPFAAANAFAADVDTKKSSTAVAASKDDDDLTDTDSEDERNKKLPAKVRGEKKRPTATASTAENDEVVDLTESPEKKRAKKSANERANDLIFDDDNDEHMHNNEAQDELTGWD